MGRIIRLTRLVRIVRLVRIATFVRSLRVLVHTMYITMKALVWAILLLFTIIYFFGVLFTQFANDHKVMQNCNTPECTDSMSDITAFWGSLVTSMLTLFESFSGGVNWGLLLP